MEVVELTLYIIGLSILTVGFQLGVVELIDYMGRGKK